MKDNEIAMEANEQNELHDFDPTNQNLKSIKHSIQKLMKQATYDSVKEI